MRAELVFAQTAVVARNVHLRPDPSTRRAAIRLLRAGEELTILEELPTAGFFHVRARDGREGWVWARNIRVAPPGGTPSGAAAPARRGTPSQPGCGDGLWSHVYNPSRLKVLNACMTVTGVMVDATAGQKIQQPDGVRHEPDGDTHGWLRVDPQFKNLIAPRNISSEGGNLVFEIICHFPITQANAKPACAGFKDTTTIPPIGSHLAITGSIVEDTLHGWNEIHPVSAIKVQ